MRPIDRRQALRVLGAPAVAPLALRLHPAVPPQEGGFKPRFLNDDELQTVAELAERILPETDTPGARRALVHQYIDYALSEGAPERRERFRAGLAWLDRRCQAIFAAPFAGLARARQQELLTRLSERAATEDEAGAAFFALARQLTVDGYYRSEVGLSQELGYRGRTFLAEFAGCTHPEHHSFEVGK
jgi:hypothetical protein